MVTMSALPVCACRRALAASTRAVSEAPRLNVIKGFGNILYSNSTSTSAGSPRPVKPNGMCVRSRRPYSTDAVSAHTPSASTTTTDKNLHTVEASGAQQPTVHALFETQTGTWQYVVADPTTSAAVIIDPVLDYDRTARAVATASADALLSLVEQKRYRVDMILETHAHADHLTAASYLQRQLVRRTGHRPPIGIGKRIGQVQELFAERYGVLEEEYRTVFDVLLEDDEVFHIGQLSASAIHLPGHTPDHMGYKIGDNVFCGDSLFHADIGTARCDFPGGSAHTLYASGRKLLSLPPTVRIWTGHDYPPDEGRGPVPCMTVEDHRRLNKHLRSGVTEDEFVSLREARDAALAAPRLLHESLQTNVRAGRMPKPSPAGQRLFHLPLKLPEAWN